MSYLVALLAFATIMALLSTVVTVIVEGVNKVLRLRSGGLKVLLSKYYQDAVAPRLPEGSGLTGDDAEAEAFAKAMCTNPVRGKGDGAKRLDKLSVRQVVEQMADTPAGAALKDLSDDELRPRLQAMAYEYDRYAENASALFHGRSRAVAVVIAIMVAFVFNVDVARLFTGLVQDQNAAARIAALAEDGALETQVLALTATTTSADPATAEEAAEALTELRARVEKLVDDAAVSTFALPLGATQYPYCREISLVFGDGVDDPRCERLRSDQQRIHDLAPDTPATETGLSLTQEVKDRGRMSTPVWLISVLVAGGMIGLGAPFWFNVYRSLATMLPAVRAASTLAGSVRAKPGAGETGVGPGGRRDDEHSLVTADVTTSFRISAGQSPVAPEPGAANPGRRRLV